MKDKEDPSGDTPLPKQEPKTEYIAGRFEPRRRRFRFSVLTTVIGLTLAVGMATASHWQWRRHVQKQAYISELQDRLQIEPVPLVELLKTAQDEAALDKIVNRRVTVTGAWDYDHETVLRNRKLGDMPGVHVLTPLKISGSEDVIIVDRGFVPLKFGSRESRAVFRHGQEATFQALVKPTMERRPLAPSDPEAGPPNPWVDQWLRPDLKAMQHQIPYPILSIYLETIPAELERVHPSDLIKTESGEDELLLLGMRKLPAPVKDDIDPNQYPAPAFSTVIPAGRHLGYVFEWAAMALGTLLITFFLQYRRTA